MMWARFVAQQDLATVLRCHVAAFEALGGVPEQILYDRMKTAVLGEVDERGIVYNAKLLALAAHYGFLPKACRPYRAKTKGKVERPFRYVREDFFLARTFRNLDDLNAQFGQWLDQVANRRLHATTGRDRRRALRRGAADPSSRCRPGRSTPCSRLERRISREGMVSVGGNLYSVPDGTRRRPVEVQVTATEVQHPGGRQARSPPIPCSRAAASAASPRATAPCRRRPTAPRPREGAGPPPAPPGLPA